ncbi:neo-calmodulin-like [Pecten maximus]|uniref:neo-calmodulin-like n=1 Tax=Pecten maximus TaxID=6579 RepID=UPI0014583170|nr:neo-calmodulin-like [Pecten maximus]
MDVKNGMNQFQIDDRIQDVKGTSEFEKFKNDHGEEFKLTFEVFDRNRDGRICIDELGIVMQACGQNPTTQQIEEAMVKLDKNGDGLVEFDEFLYDMFKIYKNPKTMSESLAAAFELFDKDNNGLIDAKEFTEIVKNLGCDPLGDKEIAEMMEVADTNKDGKIDYREFCGILGHP